MVKTTQALAKKVIKTDPLVAKYFKGNVFDVAYYVERLDPNLSRHRYVHKNNYEVVLFALFCYYAPGGFLGRRAMQAYEGMIAVPTNKNCPFSDGVLVSKAISPGTVKLQYRSFFNEGTEIEFEHSCVQIKISENPVGAGNFGILGAKGFGWSQTVSLNSNMSKWIVVSNNRISLIVPESLEHKVIFIGGRRFKKALERSDRLGIIAMIKSLIPGYEDPELTDQEI